MSSFKKCFAASAMAFAFTVALAAPRAHAADDMEATAEKMVIFFEKIADTVEENKADCDVMGAKLNTLIDGEKSLFAEAKAKQKQLSQEQKDALKKKYNARLQGAMGKMQAGMDACHTNAKVKGALKKLGDATSDK